MLKKHFKVFLALSMILVIISCTRNLVLSDKVAENFVPKDLKTKNKVLLVKVNYVKNPYKIQLPEFLAEHYMGKFEIVPASRSIDEYYPDLKVYKYVLVIGAAINASDFRGISNKEIFFDKTDSSFLRTGSSLYIFDRSSNHDLYETGEGNMTYTKQKGYSNGSNVSSSSNSGNGSFTSYEVIDYGRLKMYLKAMNN